MPPDPVEQVAFDGYVLRHERDSYAHAPMRHDLRSELIAADVVADRRITVLERWQQRMIGGLTFGALMLGGGGIAAVIEFWRK